MCKVVILAAISVSVALLELWFLEDFLGDLLGILFLGFSFFVEVRCVCGTVVPWAILGGGLDHCLCQRGFLN